MPPTSLRVARVVLHAAAVSLATAAASRAAAQAPAPAPAGEPRDARPAVCPDGFTVDPSPAAAAARRCRRTLVTWAVTSCPDSAFATYRVRPGADACAPTEVAGVGAPPGRTGTRPVRCLGAGYTVVQDRTGERDRCEQVLVQYAPARP